MGKFTFRLESLLKIYISKEDEAKREVRIWNEKLHISRDQLLNLSKRHIEALRSLVESQKGRISVHQLIDNHQFCQFLKAEVETKQRVVVDIEETIEIKKNTLYQIIKQRKMLDKLKEKQYFNFVAEEERSFQKEMDEITTSMSIS